MTTSNTLTLRSFDIPSIHRFGVGFDSLFNELARLSNQPVTNYPPYNVIKHTEDKYSIELAVAGFKEGEISVEVDKNVLSIKGEQATELDANFEYLHRGISARSFTRTFNLAEHVEVRNAEISNGILTVVLERQVPEELQPKKIQITFNK